MSSINFLVAICFMILTLRTRFILSENSPRDYLAGHNAARAEVGVGPISWNNTVATYAQQYANQRIPDCALEHSRGPYGENIAMGYGEFNGVQAVKLWVDEKPNYDYASNSCISDQCLHYTQVTWRKTTQIGCARAQCKNGWAFITCNYYPPGNWVGERPF